MRTFLLATAALALVGCGQTTTTFVKSETTLGRVVVYRNGVAYFERFADVQGDSLKLSVPADKVDDFLKSLTVVDAKTGEPAPISYPQPNGSATIDMKIGVTRPGGTKLRLSYVTEAPSWKPSYRITVGQGGKVDLQGWAIVDNTSGEDWRDVKLGVGASSAMAFRFDLKGLRTVERETLKSNDLFALAPPTGGSTYGGPASGGTTNVAMDLSDEVIEGKLRPEGVAIISQPTTAKKDGREYRLNPKAGAAAAPTDATEYTRQAAPDPVSQLAQNLQRTQNMVVVEGYAAAGDGDKMNASLARANKLRDQLVRQGIDPARVMAVGKGEQQGRAGGARVVETNQAAANGAKAPNAIANAKATAEPAASAGTDPIGTSHFESQTAMTVARGTSAMVSILRDRTEGEVVYLYDPESARGNATYPFRTLRFRNPTDSALESGPVSVFGEGRFIGEGMAEPIPGRALAFVPFALDRQVVVERKDEGRDAIAKILTVQRGVFQTEIQHTKRSAFTLFNRLPEKAVVYLRHTVAPGYSLVKSTAVARPEGEHIGGANLFRVELAPNGKSEVVIEEATPVFKTTDIRTTAGMDLVRAYLSSAAADGPLRGQVQKLLDLNTKMANVEQQIGTIREQMGEYRTRMDELHAQLVTLKAVKTAGPLMGHLEKKLQEMSEKLSKATVDVVSLQEKQMLARVEFQAGVAELTLERSPEKEKIESAQAKGGGAT
jgi:hypothetical protein